MSPKIVDKEKKRKEIYEAALKVFSDKGMSGFKMIDVACEAGIGKGTIYEYFDSKEGLIIGCFQEFMKDYGFQLLQKLNKDTDPKMKIIDFFQFSFQYFSVHQKEMSIMFDFFAAAIPRRHGTQILPGMDKEYAEFQKFVSMILKDGVKQGLFREHDTDTIALIMLGIIDGLMFQAVLGVIDITDKSLPNKISHTILEGILND